MSEEPKIVTEVEQDSSSHRSWYKQQMEAARADGCTFARFSYHEENPRRALFEAWVVQPADQGPQRWTELPDAG